MSFDEFLATNFSFTNNSGKKISKLGVQVTAQIRKAGSGSGSQYITATLYINGTSSGNFPSVVLSTYSTTTAEVESVERTKNVSILDGGTFYIDFSATKSNIISIEEMTNLKLKITY